MTKIRSGWVDTHVHWDAAEFEADRDEALQRAYAAGVTHCLNPSVDVQSMGHVHALATASMQRVDWPTLHPAFGIHPLYVNMASPRDLDHLVNTIVREQPIAIGEIGLDRYPGAPDFALQKQWFEAQLALAIEYDLPVLLHVRHAVEDVIQSVRSVQGRGSRQLRGGIAHAFNGSLQQALQLVDMGFLLGFGGTLTYNGSTRIHQLARELPMENLVLETDAPDMPPSWLRRQRNQSSELPRIAESLASLRQIEVGSLRESLWQNVCRVFPTVGCRPRHDAGAQADSS